MDANSEHLLARHGLRSCADLAVLRPRCVTSSCRNAAAQAQLYGVESPTQNLTIKAPRLADVETARAWKDSAKGWTADYAGRRKVWVLIPFGSHLSMLQLHIETLAGVVDGFLVTESHQTFTRNKRNKPLLVSRELREGGSLHNFNTKIHVLEVDLHEAAVQGHCSKRPVGYARTSCLENWQRFQLLGLLATHANGTEDIAVLADHDEIAHPDTILMLRHCFPFNASSQASMFNMLIMEATHYEFGLHCRKPKIWLNGPRAFAARFLLQNFWIKRGFTQNISGPIQLGRSMSDRFSNLRAVLDAGHPSMGGHAAYHAYHLSSFGSGFAIRSKFSSWGHANRLLADDEQTELRRQVERYESPRIDHENRTTHTGFTGFEKNGFENLALDPERLSRCAKLCLSPYPQQRLDPISEWTPNEFVVNTSRPLVVPPCLHGLPSTARAHIMRNAGDARLFRIAPTPLSRMLGLGQNSDVSNGTDQAFGFRSSIDLATVQTALSSSFPSTFRSTRFASLLYNYSGLDVVIDVEMSAQRSAKPKRDDGRGGFRGVWRKG